MAFTYSKLAESTVGSGGTSAITFNNIPQNYTDLVLKTSLRLSVGGDWCLLTINGSSSNFSGRELYGSGSSVSSFTRSTNQFIVLTNQSGYTANSFSNSEHYFANYSGNTNKSFSADQVQETNATASNIMMDAFLWSNPAAINQLTITPGAGNLVQYSTATLYGIRVEL
jgi:hypothetical protein